MAHLSKCEWRTRLHSFFRSRGSISSGSGPGLELDWSPTLSPLTTYEELSPSLLWHHCQIKGVISSSLAPRSPAHVEPVVWLSLLSHARSSWYSVIVQEGRTNECSPGAYQALEGQRFELVSFFWGTSYCTPIGIALGAIATQMVDLGPSACCVLDTAVFVVVSEYTKTKIEIVLDWKLEPPRVLDWDRRKETLLGVM